MTAAADRFDFPPLDLAAELRVLNERLARLTGTPCVVCDDAIDWQFATLVHCFRLNGFEQRALLFAAAAELHGRTRDLVAHLGSGPPSIGLLLRVCLAEHEAPEIGWRALRPDGALRRGHLLTLGEPALRFTERPVWVEESVLQSLHGQVQLDSDLLACALVLPMGMGSAAPQYAVARVVETLVSNGLALLELVCDDLECGLAVACESLSQAGLGSVVLPLASLPRDPAALSHLRQVWLRDAMIHQLGLVLIGDGSPLPVPVELVCGWGTPLLVLGAVLPAAACGIRTAIDTTRDHQPELWQTSLSCDAAFSERIAFTFPLSAATIRSIGQSSASPSEAWVAARSACRPRDEGLVERIEPQVRLEDVIVPGQVQDVLHALVEAGHGHHRVARDWSRGRTVERGLSITALFSGESGTGKTMAAEAIAGELGLDLYRVELSAVVSKYIGETERNLRRVFTESVGAVLLFDEADALFGKRSEVRDAHDRYANMEVGYLLQQMESYRGIAILTTNMPDSIDSAFVRRLRFIARFSLPGASERERIWQGAFPKPVNREMLNFARLAKLSLTGAVIRNIALGASFRAAATDRAVTMADVIAAARMEMIKLGRPLTEIDGRDWS